MCYDDRDFLSWVPILGVRNQDIQDSLVIEIWFLIFAPKIMLGLIFTQNSYIIIPDWFIWPLGKELDFSLFLKFLSI